MATSGVRYVVATRSRERVALGPHCGLMVGRMPGAVLEDCLDWTRAALARAQADGIEATTKALQRQEKALQGERERRWAELVS